MADLMESRCGSLPTAQLTPHAEQFLSLLERKGIVPDQEITNEKARSADKALRKNMYHNTRQMLQHYRDIAWALECFPARVAEELDRPLHIWMPYSLLSMHSWPCRIIGWSIGWNV